LNGNNNYSSPSPNNISGQNIQGLKKGDRGNEVIALQQKLQQLGYFQGKITGYFGSQTQQSVKQFQLANKLNPDGIAGKNTLNSLNKNSPNQDSLKKENKINNQGEMSKTNPSINLNTNQIKIIQEQLKNRGYYQGKIDGVYSINIRNSLLKFQKDNNITNSHRILVDNFQGYTSSFGPRHSSISNRQENHFGLDFAAPLNSYIRNWHKGIVIELSDHTACGTLIRIQSGNFEHIYCHLKGSIKTDSKGRYLYDPESGLNIRQGQTINTGEKIGRIGMTGRTTGPHLHWGLKYKQTFIDPFLVLLN
jgi:peptidoglycan hydrolase-like protein with peptidoglycan-binding domain